MGDVKTLVDFINSLVEEDALILVNKTITFQEEKKWVKENLELCRKGEQHLLVAMYKKEVVGTMGLHRGKWRQSHVGTIGVSVKKSYRGIGLGTLLMKTAIGLAKKDPKIKILTLDVYEPNKIARKLYEKLGFKSVAKLSKRDLYKGKYISHIVMEYPLNKIK